MFDLWKMIYFTFTGTGRPGSKKTSACKIPNVIFNDSIHNKAFTGTVRKLLLSGNCLPASMLTEKILLNTFCEKLLANIK